MRFRTCSVAPVIVFFNLLDKEALYKKIVFTEQRIISVRFDGFLGDRTSVALDRHGA